MFPSPTVTMVLFMQAARWADDIRTEGQATPPGAVALHQLPFKPEGQPASVQIREPEPVTS